MIPREKTQNISMMIRSPYPIHDFQVKLMVAGPHMREKLGKICAELEHTCPVEVDANVYATAMRRAHVLGNTSLTDNHSPPFSALCTLTTIATARYPL
jgi:hypothetical protein